MDVLGAIGNTPLVELRRLVPSGSARILLKMEMANPTGSMKDRMARAVIEAAERRRQLAPGGTVVEYTGGTTGISLAFLCAAKGYKIQIVFSDAFSQEKALIMKALGARLAIVPSEGRGITENLVRQMIEKARALSREPGHWWSDQLRNEDAMGGYHALAIGSQGDRRYAGSGYGPALPEHRPLPGVSRPMDGAPSVCVV
jgi:cysteine synthase A